MSKSPLRLLAICLAAALAACSQAPVATVQDVQVIGGDRSVELDSVSLLKALVTVQGGADTAVTWSVADDSVVTVDADGLMTAVALGSTTVTATSTSDPTKSDTAAITVELDPAAPSTVTGSTITPAGEPAPVGA